MSYHLLSDDAFEDMIQRMREGVLKSDQERRMRDMDTSLEVLEDLRGRLEDLEYLKREFSMLMAVLCLPRNRDALRKEPDSVLNDLFCLIDSLRSRVGSKLGMSTNE